MFNGATGVKSSLLPGRHRSGGGAGAGSERGTRGFSLSPPPPSSPFTPATQLRLGVKLVHSTGLGARYSYTHVIH